MNIIIRKSQIEDLKSIQKLNNLLFKLEKENFDSTLIDNWPLSKDGEDYFRDLINNHFVFVAINDDEIIGYLAGTINEKGSYENVSYGEINNMFIIDKYRSLGIGKLLVDEFKKCCINAGINNLKVTASAKNHNAINFYKKMGFNEFDITLTNDLILDTKNNINLFILHSLNGDTLKMWGKDIEETYNKKGIDVIMPQFPIREKSSYAEFNRILTNYLNDGTLNENTVIVAHSIGNAYFIRFCYEHHYKPKVYIAVAPGAIYEYPSNRNDYIVEVKKQAYLKKEMLVSFKKLDCIKYCIYSDEDDNNSEKFTRFINDTRSKSLYLKYYNHFDGYHRIYKIPELIELIDSIIKH